MNWISRSLNLGVLGAGVFSIVIAEFFALIEGQPLERLARILIGAGGAELDRDCLRPR